MGRNLSISCVRVCVVIQVLTTVTVFFVLIIDIVEILITAFDPEIRKHTWDMLVHKRTSSNNV